MEGTMDDKEIREKTLSSSSLTICVNEGNEKKHHQKLSESCCQKTEYLDNSLTKASNHGEREIGECEATFSVPCKTVSCNVNDVNSDNNKTTTYELVEIMKTNVEYRDSVLSIHWHTIESIPSLRSYHFLSVLRRIRNIIKKLSSPSLSHNTIKLLGSEATVEKEIEKMKEAILVIHPLSKMRQVWDFIIMGMLIVNLFVLPVDIAFFTDTNTWLRVHILSDTLCLLDIILNFRTGYRTRVKKQFNLEGCQIAKHYLKTWFVIDLISSLPLEYIVLEM